MVKAMDCEIGVSEFELQSRYYVHKYPWEIYELPYPPNYGLNSTTTVLLGEWLWYKITHKGWYAIKQRNRNHFSFHSFFYIYLFLHFFLCFFFTLLFIYFLFRSCLFIPFFYTFSIIVTCMKTLFLYFCRGTVVWLIVCSHNLCWLIIEKQTK